MAMSAHSDRLDQFEKGNAVGGHAGEVEAGRLGVPVDEQPPDHRGYIVSSAQKSGLSARGTALSVPA
jgi:hypothetical protein